MTFHALTEWAAAAAADFPLPTPEVADRLVAILLPENADREDARVA